MPPKKPKKIQDTPEVEVYTDDEDLVVPFEGEVEETVDEDDNILPYGESEDSEVDDDDDSDSEEDDGDGKVAVRIDPITFSEITRPIDPSLPKNYYFDNDYVEGLLTEYVKGGCTNVELRDRIMSNAEELIKQIIRTHKLHLITNGKEGTAFGDLYQLAWVQIESSLYKFDYRPGHTKVFNMWSQVAKTVMLAHIKKESRDRRNYGAYKEHLDSRHRPAGFKFQRFLEEAREICTHHTGYSKVLDAIEFLFDNDPRPYDGLIDKLVRRSGLTRTKVSAFLRMVRLRSYEFTDAPLNEDAPHQDHNKYRVIHTNFDPDED
jgi:hypothetical protein